MKKTGVWEWAQKTKNIYYGCKNNCRYCYARANALRFKRIEDPGVWPNMVLNEKMFLEKPKYYKNKTIMFPTSHDIVPENVDNVITYLLSWLSMGNKFLIVTKPRYECVEKICAAAHFFKDQILFRFTVGSIHDYILKFWEPSAPRLLERLKSLEYALKCGFETSVSCEPMLDTDIGLLIDKLLPFVTETIWVGKMNRIDQRVNMGDWSNTDLRFLEYVRKSQEDDFILRLYRKYKDNPKVKWKDSVRKVVDQEKILSFDQGDPYFAIKHEVVTI